MVSNTLFIVALGIVAGLLSPLVATVIMLLTAMALSVNKLPPSAMQSTGQMFVVVWVYTTIMCGPVAAVLGSVGAWLLVVQRRHGAHRGRVLCAGVVVGAIFGVVCLIASLVLARLLITRGQGIDVLTLAPLLNPRNVYFAIAALTGAIVGFLAAAVVSRTASV